ncbi:Alpha/Beta hydrolase protein [Aspergillus crustosus]
MSRIWLAQCIGRNTPIPASLSIRQRVTIPLKHNHSLHTFQNSSTRHKHRSIQQAQRNPVIPRFGSQSRPLSSITSSIPLFSSLPTPLIPPAIFIGLLLTLWTWKCLWIIILQDKLLYLSWLPPFSRSDKIEDYQKECAGVNWVEKQIRSWDGTKLVVCEGRVNPGSSLLRRVIENESVEEKTRKKTVVIAYFQGNGGSTPMRLPLLSGVLRGIAEVHSQQLNGGYDTDVEYILVALSYRGFWKSSGRATQRGIELDAQAFLSWITDTYTNPEMDLRVVLWGHSLGAAVASSAVVRVLAGMSAEATTTPGGMDRANTKPPITGLILEAPISSIKDMLISLYPQKWLPYRYLWPFSWNNWDVAASLHEMGRYKTYPRFSNEVPPIFLLSAESDEVIPLWVADQLKDKARRSGLEIRRMNVKGAMHIEGPLKQDGRKALADFIRGAGWK